MTMTKMMTMTKTKTPLLDDLPTLCLVVKEDDVDLLGQLRHRGEDEGERGDDHHRHRGECANLENRIYRVIFNCPPSKCSDYGKLI